MPGTTHVSSSSTDTTTPPGVREDVDLDRTVWFGGGEAYHRATDWGPACVDQIGRLDEHTLADAVDEDLRPCRQCEPVDYRRLATDGGAVARQSTSWDSRLRPVNLLTSKAWSVANQVDTDRTRDRVRLAFAGVEHLQAHGDLVEMRLAEIDRHLTVASDTATTNDVRSPVRDALQIVRALRENGGRR